MGFMHDTTPEAERVYYDTLARISPEQRLIRANRYSLRMKAILLDSIRDENPDFSERQVKLEFFRRIMTDEEFETLLAAST